MRRSLLILALFASPAPPPPAVTVLFSPHGGCTARIVAEIDAARVSVRAQYYTFTSRPIAEAIARARGRGLDVQVILDDASNAHNPVVQELLVDRLVPVTFDAKHAISHNKVCIIDGSTVLGGSFNASAAAETSNAENLTVIVDPAVAATYLANWTAHRSHSGPHVARQGAAPASPPEF